MKRKAIAAYAVSLMLAVSCLTCACGKKSESGDPSAGETSSSQQTTVNKTSPLMSVGSYTASAGDNVDVTVSLSNLDGKWSMCGIYLTYDNRLECITSADDPSVPKMKRGDAASEMMSAAANIWLTQEDGSNNPEDSIGKGRGAVFFATMGDGDCGKDGDLVTFTFKVPDDAEKGTVYDFGFFHNEYDMFTNAANDKSLYDTIRENWQEGTLTVQ